MTKNKETEQKPSNFKTGFKDIAELKFDGATLKIKRPDVEFNRGLSKVMESFRDVKEDDEAGHSEMLSAINSHCSKLITGWSNLVYKGQNVPFCKENAAQLINGKRFDNAFSRFINNQENWATEEELEFRFDLKN